MRLAGDADRTRRCARTFDRASQPFAPGTVGGGSHRVAWWFAHRPELGGSQESRRVRRRVSAPRWRSGGRGVTLTFQPVRIATCHDEDGRLVFADDRLVAVLVRLSDEHEI